MRLIQTPDECKVYGEYTGKNENGEDITRPYSLKGWIGIHSTISSEVAKKNDDNFSKNKFYNPIQLRLYVRNKLAIENFLNLINNTQAFVNYIEGEISFDILDDDNFPDIATSNRQNIDEHDKRVELLKRLVHPIILDLMLEHINQGRAQRKEPFIPFFATPMIPTDIEMKARGQSIEQYMDGLFLQHWDHYILDGIDNYLQRYQ